MYYRLGKSLAVIALVIVSMMGCFAIALLVLQ